ncbi:MAG TPA: lactonase family protein [Candidatus Didemnitutus sp.]|nr:lactonase family protein [Candidatus Didemnitutus sp.]
MKSLRTMLLAAAAASAVLPGSAAEYRLFVGTYTPKGGPSQGIYSLTFDSATGQLGRPEVAAAMMNPSFLVARPGGNVLFAEDESSDPAGKLGGSIAAFAFDPASPKLSLLNHQGGTGAHTAHLAVDGTGRMVIASSYTGGQIASFPVEGDGHLGTRVSWLHPKGDLGPNKARQEAPHAHSATFSPDNRFAYVCDLGLDRIFIYRVDPVAATLTPAAPASIATTPGAGPRHGAFSAEGKFLYVVNELNATVTTYARDAATGALSGVQTVGTLPTDFHGTNTCAEIAVHPNGKFLYASNRGHDSLAVFSRNADTGELTRVEIVPSGGRHPRHFALSPDGNWLICANRDTNNLVVFKVDTTTGRLTATGATASVPLAVCVLFVPVK